MNKKDYNDKLNELLFDIQCLIWKQTLTSQLNGEKEFEKRLYGLLNDIKVRFQLEMITKDTILESKTE